MATIPRRRPNGKRAHPGLLRRAVRRDERGQAITEFALIVTPLIFLLLGIVQFGFIFQAYITVANAVREGARDASIYTFDTTITQAQNDTCRNEMARRSMLGAFNGLVKTSPNLVNTGVHSCGPGNIPTGTWTITTNTSNLMVYTDGDLTITYTLPENVTDSDPRAGWRISVKANYHQDIIVPIIGALLPHDANGRFVVGAESTMVLN